MEFINLTRGTEIGANSYLIRSRKRALVFDAGMHPKCEGQAALPDFSHIPEGKLDAVFITHAHQDHIGALPVLTQRERQARVFMSQPTSEIADIMLHNSVNVMQHQSKEGRGDPLFTHRGVDLSQNAWQPCRMLTRYSFDGERASTAEDNFEFHHAGHILGASGVKITLEGKTIFYTGDVNFENQTLIRGAQFPTKGVDVLIMETTRGDQATPPGFTRAKEEDRLGEAILEAFATDSAVTIPVFALGKTQELLAMLWRLQERGAIPRVPLYIGGLSNSISKLYDEHSKDAQRIHSEFTVRKEADPFIMLRGDLANAKVRKRAIYALSSGMMTENTGSNLFARKILADPAQHLFFIGYSDPDSPAGKVRATEQGAPVFLDEASPPLPLNCNISEFSFSSHASREGLLNYATKLSPKKIILVHGDPSALDWFHESLRRVLPNTEVIIAEPGQPIAL